MHRGTRVLKLPWRDGSLGTLVSRTPLSSPGFIVLRVEVEESEYQRRDTNVWKTWLWEKTEIRQKGSQVLRKVNSSRIPSALLSSSFNLGRGVNSWCTVGRRGFCRSDSSLLSSLSPQFSIFLFVFSFFSLFLFFLLLSSPQFPYSFLFSFCFSLLFRLFSLSFIFFSYFRRKDV